MTNKTRILIVAGCLSALAAIASIRNPTVWADAAQTQTAAFATLQAQHTLTAQASITPSATSTPTFTPTPWPTLTAGPSATPPATAGSHGAHWRWPVCGAANYRFVGTSFDHYMASQYIYPTESPLKESDDGVGLIVPHSIDLCFSGQVTGSGACSDPLISASDNRNVTEFANGFAAPVWPPSNLVYAPHYGRVLWVGPTTFNGAESSTTTTPCRTGDWRFSVLVQHHGGEFAIFKDLSTVTVKVGDNILGGQVIGESAAAVPYGGNGASNAARISVEHDNGSEWFDPQGWGDESQPGHTDFNQVTDPFLALTGHQSPRLIEQNAASGQACMVPCGSTTYIVDSTSGGFACSTCSGNITSGLAYGGSYKTLSPSGSEVSSDRATWTASTAPLGVYAVYARTLGSTDTNSDGVNDLSASPVTRYVVGDKTTLASQRPSGPASAGWQYIGTFNYSTAPYLSMSNAAYSDLLVPAKGYIDTPECGRMVADAVMFIPQCAGPRSRTDVSGTAIPAATPTPSCILYNCSTGSRQGAQ